MLNSHPDILCHHELFNRNHIWYALGYRNGEIELGSIKKRNLAPKRFIKNIWAMDFEHGAVGFKLLRSQCRRALIHTSLDRSVKKIILRRRNHLATYVSRQTGKLTQSYTSFSDAKVAPRTSKVLINVRDFKRYAGQIRRHFFLIRRLQKVTKQTYLEICYEDLLEDHVKKSLLQYLCVKPDPALMQPVHKKQSVSPLLDRIANAEEVVAKLKNTLYESDLMPETQHTGSGPPALRNGR